MIANNRSFSIIAHSRPGVKGKILLFRLPLQRKKLHGIIGWNLSQRSLPMPRNASRPSRLFWLTPLLVALPLLAAVCTAVALYWPKLRSLVSIVMKLVVTS